MSGTTVPAVRLAGISGGRYVLVQGISVLKEYFYHQRKVGKQYEESL